MQTQLRYWDYYGLINTFEELYEKSKQGNISFTNLYELIKSRENILLAYRTIKSNKGSKTAGVDGRTIDDYKKFTDDDLVSFIQKRLSNYQPMKVKRVLIPKPNGDKRPLGIPSMSDRIIQQAFKQVLEPICEAKFYNHSYGFRPLRTTHHAIARVNYLININKLHFVVDVDIKGFFDNVNHTLLIKQLWNLGIRDRIVLRLISKMLKAEIDGEGIPTKGTPQGGILSPLLSNVVLNDLDNWIASQWENFQSNHQYSSTHKFRALKKTNLKEGYIVRYADDFKILCKDWKTAERWFHAVRLYLKDRLKLEISPEKSKIVNLRKKKSEFLGFSISAELKNKKRVAYTRLTKKKKQLYKEEGIKRIKAIQKNSTAQNALLYNSWVLGIHNYNKYATHVNSEFNEIAFQLSRTLKDRLTKCSIYEKPINPPLSYKRFYKGTSKTFKVCDVYLYPIHAVSHTSVMNYSQWLTPFTKDGREHIYTNLDGDVLHELGRLMKSNIPNRSIEYLDNRLSRYSMKKGKCEITGHFLTADLVHCHHFTPAYMGGNDDFNNLRIINKLVHRLIHSTTEQTVREYLELLKLKGTEIKKVNAYRKVCNLEPIGY
ncbi:group II intron reverse transcriptase/maturase (plasmid) [Cytobacillus pseudoceanisediminis]|uniref:group II intron reverse transcriptase/maturase n=1 Tax=Cytobacillus pseudoceanisediminis TaxID=3051614 RepID=UPI00218745B3|nr:group II intron reverse transcriptase/maturase [Cytobacillus pseudoceanisediminis]UQX57088.1 group II intron reverse transcriptase/maturase [Cytobacillus pseudoceanisediminis]